MKEPRVAIMGLTFKENTPDTRNTRVVDIYHELRDYDIHPFVCDPVADKEEAKEEYGINLIDLEEVKDMDVIIFAVAHEEFKSLSHEEIKSMFKKDNRILIDIKGFIEETKDYIYWSL